MPFKPQNFSLILINGTLTLTSKIEDFLRVNLKQNFRGILKKP